MEHLLDAWYSFKLELCHLIFTRPLLDKCDYYNDSRKKESVAHGNKGKGQYHIAASKGDRIRCTLAEQSPCGYELLFMSN